MKPRGWVVDAGLLEKLLGGNRGWSPACTVVFDGDAAVKTPGPDNIMSGGMKSYAPRYATGRIEADSCYLLKEHSAMIVVQQAKYRDATGAEHIRQTMLVADIGHVMGIEFSQFTALQTLGVPQPPAVREGEYRPGTLVG
jgi:hypothetical protein